MKSNHIAIDINAKNQWTCFANMYKWICAKEGRLVTLTAIYFVAYLSGLHFSFIFMSVTKDNVFYVHES